MDMTGIEPVAPQLGIKIRQMEGHGGPVANQWIIYADHGRYFQSYNTVIAYVSHRGEVFLDELYWNYSSTTGKYRQQFLGEDRKATYKKVKDGEYHLVRLNPENHRA